MTSELKPCPFCGGEAVETIAGVSCTKCGGTMHGGIQYGGADWDKVRDAWNTRVERTCRLDCWFGEWYCTACGELVGTCDTASKLHVGGNAVELWSYCPQCGAKVVSE